MNLGTRLLRQLAHRWPLEQIASSSIRKRIWNGTLKLLRPQGPVDVRLHGRTFRVDPRQRQTLGRHLLKKCDYEPFESRLFQSFLKQGMTVADVGANIGHFTTLAAQHVGPHGRVFAFEPSPIAFQELRTNIALNNLENVIPFPIAIGSENGSVTLYQDKRCGGHHSLQLENLRQPGTSVEVSIRTLDDIRAEQGGSIDLLKMDAQGAEAAILAGAEDILESDRPILFTEYWPYGLAHMGTDPQGPLKKLAWHDYKLCRIQHQALCLTTPKHLVAELSSKRARDDANLLCIPEERWEILAEDLPIQRAA